MSLSSWLLGVSWIFYTGAFITHLLSFWGVWEHGHRPGFALMRAGFLISTFYLAAEAIEQGIFLPVRNFPQAFAFFAWSLAFIYLVLLVRIQNESFGLVLTPILLALIGIATIAKLYTHPEPVKDILLNPYFTVHIISAFFAYACFTLSFAAGILYLIQYRELKEKHAGRFYHKLPSLEELERLIYQPVLWGAPLLGLAIGIGFLWSKSVSGQYWILDPKTITTALIVLLYSVILYLRYISAFRGKQGAVLSVIAFGLVLFSFVGLSFVQGSHHFLQ